MPIGPVFPELRQFHAVAAVCRLRTIKGLREAILDPELGAPLQACCRVARSWHRHRQEAVRDERRWAGGFSVAYFGQPSHLRAYDRCQ